MKYIKLFYSISLFIYLTTFALAKDYLVSDIKILNKTIKHLKAGDTITIKDGIYKNVKINFRANATKKAPIILKAQHKGKVIFAGKTFLSIKGNYLIVDGFSFKNGYPIYTSLIQIGHRKKPSNHCQLRNITIDSFNDTNTTKRHDWVVIIGGQYNSITKCHFNGMTNKGVTLKVVLPDNALPNYHTVANNIFSNRAYGQSENGYESIRIGDSKHSLQISRTMVKDNIFDKCDGEIEIISNKSSQNYYVHNIFRNSRGMLTLRHGNDCIVKDNIFLGYNNKDMGGIRIVGTGHKIINNYLDGVGVSSYRAAISFMNGMPNAPLYQYTQVSDCIIKHNMILNSQYPIGIGANYKNSKYPLFPKNVIFSNNMIINSNINSIYKMQSKIKNLSFFSNTVK